MHGTALTTSSRIAVIILTQPRQERETPTKPRCPFAPIALPFSPAPSPDDRTDKTAPATHPARR